MSENEPKYAVVNFNDLGTSCWLPKRFIQRQRCERVQACKYPEKQTCKAVGAEIDFLSHRIIEIGEITIKHQQDIGKTIMQLMAVREK